MSKPLELKTFPLWESLGGTMYTGDTQDDVVNVDFEVYRKRLTDAELAAEYWGVRATLEGGLITSHDLTVPWRSNCAAIRDSMTPAGQRIREQVDTLLRFASLPHYDEDQP